MRFYRLLAGVNFACFRPLHVLDLGAAPNPFHFPRVADKTRRLWPLKICYLRHVSTDPYRIDFTRHAGFLSLFVRALQWAHGVQREVDVACVAGGAPLFDPTEASVP